MQFQDLNHSIDSVSDLIIKSTRIVVFTGAGISTESGIPDFRGRGGIWSKFDPDEFTIQRFLNSSESREKHWKMFIEGGLTRRAEPNHAHHAIAEMEKLGKLDCIITQNVDNLHQEAGNSEDRIYELHGNIRRIKCLGCGKLVQFDDILPRLEKGEIPSCESCHGILKPDVILFGEQLCGNTLELASQHSRNSDLFIVIGSTLVVYPAAYMPSYAVESGADLVIINLGSTPLDTQAQVLINAKAGEAMLKIMEKVKNKLTAKDN